MPVNIRHVAVKDAGSIASIYNHYIEETIVTFEETPVTSRDVLTRIDKVTSDGFDWLVAEQQGKIIGYAYSSVWKARAAYRRTAEVSVYVDHRYTGSGVGTSLYQVLFSHLRDKGYHLAIAGISLPNPASIKLHERFGMIQVAHFREVGFKFQRWLDVGYWQMTLDNSGQQD